MAQYLTNLLILPFLVSALPIYTAQTTTLDEEGDHITGACMPVTELCNILLNGSFSSEQYHSVFELLTICDSIMKICHDGHISSVIAKPMVEASISKPSTIFGPVTKLSEGLQISSVTAKHTGVALKGICNPHTHKCIGPKIYHFVLRSGKDTICVDDSVISGEEAMVNPMLSVCFPRKGTCRGNHHGFGIAKPRDAA